MNPRLIWPLLQFAAFWFTHGSMQLNAHMWPYSSMKTGHGKFSNANLFFKEHCSHTLWEADMQSKIATTNLNSNN